MERRGGRGFRILRSAETGIRNYDRMHHHPDDGPPIPAPDPSLFRDIVCAGLLLLLALITPALAIAVHCAR